MLNPPRMQVVVEVHDINGRLASICSLLRRHGFSVRSEPQRGGDVEGYRMVVPQELRLWYVFALRAPTKDERDARARGGMSPGAEGGEGRGSKRKAGEETVPGCE